MIREHAGLKRVVTATTRAPREGEEDGVDYHFLSKEVFQARIAAGEFYEYACVHGCDRYYGTPKAAVAGPLSRGSNLLLVIDVQGAAAFRDAARNDSALAASLLTVFLKPRNLEQLRERLKKRGADSDAEIERRLRTAADELAEAQHFDRIVHTGTPDEDFAALTAIYLGTPSGRGVL